MTNEQKAQMIDGAARHWLASPGLSARDALWGYMRQQGLRRAFYACLSDGGRRQMTRDVVARAKVLRAKLDSDLAALREESRDA